VGSSGLKPLLSASQRLWGHLFLRSLDGLIESVPRDTLGSP
jgi:hypothetical protein